MGARGEPLLAARPTWSTGTSAPVQFVDGSLEALHPRLSTGLPLSGALGREVRADDVRVSSGLPPLAVQPA